MYLFNNPIDSGKSNSGWRELKIGCIIQDRVNTPSVRGDRIVSLVNYDPKKGVLLIFQVRLYFVKLEGWVVRPVTSSNPAIKREQLYITSR